MGINHFVENHFVKNNNYVKIICGGSLYRKYLWCFGIFTNEPQGLGEGWGGGVLQNCNRTDKVVIRC
jgi:hypothetical protein